MRNSRFRHRPKRIARRDERNTFASIVMPLAWMAGMIGVASVIGAVLHFGVNGEWHRGAIGAGAILALVPLWAALLRFFRGHYNSALDEP